MTAANIIATTGNITIKTEGKDYRVIRGKSDFADFELLFTKQELKYIYSLLKVLIGDEVDGEERKAIQELAAAATHRRNEKCAICGKDAAYECNSCYVDFCGRHMNNSNLCDECDEKT